MNGFEKANRSTMRLPPASFSVYRPIEASLMPTARYGDSLRLRRIDIKRTQDKTQRSTQQVEPIDRSRGSDPFDRLKALNLSKGLSKSFPGT